MWQILQNWKVRQVKIRVIKTLFRKRVKNIVDIAKCLNKRLPLRLIFLCDVDIDSIPRGTAFGHPFGICINSGTQIGKGCDIRHGVTLGKINPKGDPEKITVGNNVFIGCNASVLGQVTIGDNVIIGAHALVLKDVPNGMKIKGLWK